MMMVNSPSNGGVAVTCRNSVGVRVSSKVKNKVYFINTTNRFRPRRSFSAVMKESVQWCRFITYTAHAAGAARAEQLLRVYVRREAPVLQCLAHLQ